MGRKLGSVPAAVDEDGKDINPHIPQYISDAPWYLDPKGPTLTHQRQQEEKIKKFSGITEWYNRGVDSSKTATRYRKGACENCGAITHKKKDCLERPRKVGAKYTGANFAPDEHVQPKLAPSYDGERDRWNGYDAEEYREVVENHKKLAEARKEVKKNMAKEKAPDQEDDGESSSDEEDEDKYVDDMEMVGTKHDAAERYTVRNLRIREDTAKYLRNLDPNSAYYDPKTRAMRKNPYEDLGKGDEEVDYAGDNFVRVTCDTVEHAKAQLFAWEAGGKGLDVHALAEPTKLEALKREYVSKKSELKDEAKSKIFDEYGGEEHLKAPPRELIFSQTEEYVEYSRTGKVIKGQESNAVKSRYEEDVYLNNHTSIFGSFFHEGKWGYKCCHSFIKNSYCTGDAGKAAFAVTPFHIEANQKEEASISVKEDGKDMGSIDEATAAAIVASASEEENSEELESSSTSKSKKKKKKKKKKKGKEKEKDFEEQVSEAMKKQASEEAKPIDERKRGYNSMYDAKAPTEAEMEAYYRKRERYEDPMKNF